MGAVSKAEECHKDQHASHTTRKIIRDIAVAAGFSVGAAELAILGLFGSTGLITHPTLTRWLSFLGVVVILTFYNSFYERRNSEVLDNNGRNVLRAIIVAFAVNGLSEFLGDSLNLVAFVTAFPLPFFLTFGWLRGQSHPHKAALFGFLAGAVSFGIAGSVIVLCALLFSHDVQYLLKYWGAPDNRVLLFLGYTAELAAMSGTLGFLVGYWLDHSRLTSTIHVLTSSLIISAVLLCVVAGIAWFELLPNLPPGYPYSAVGYLALVTGTLAWALFLRQNQDLRNLVETWVGAGSQSGTLNQGHNAHKKSP